MKQIKTLIAFVTVVAFSSMALAQVAGSAPATALKASGVVSAVDAKAMTFSLPVLDAAGKPTEKTTTYSYNDATKFTWATEDMTPATAADLKAGVSISETYSTSGSGNLALSISITPATGAAAGGAAPSTTKPAN